jgi:hypothetical protein
VTCTTTTENWIEDMIAGPEIRVELLSRQAFLELNTIKSGFPYLIKSQLVPLVKSQGRR